MGQNGTFIAENGLTGCDFSICTYYKEINTAIYGDSFKWPASGRLIEKIHRYVKGFFREPENILLREYHNLMRQLSRDFIVYPIFLFDCCKFSQTK